ncbi:MAG TPA: hypothetical protein VMW29_02405 [Candidatus Bathyarchaeia archaeon]|nr:hypothetical protein [Candidatus Bathyarchaeia archaeon]
MEGDAAHQGWSRNDIIYDLLHESGLYHCAGTDEARQKGVQLFDKALAMIDDTGGVDGLSSETLEELTFAKVRFQRPLTPEEEPFENGQTPSCLL